MLRSAAKNHAAVSVLCDPVDYTRLLDAMGDQSALRKLRQELALKVYQRTSSYDYAISSFLEKQLGDEPDLDAISGVPSSIHINSPRAQKLRYGENPHQKLHSMANFLRTLNSSKARS